MLNRAFSRIVIGLAVAAVAMGVMTPAEGVIVNKKITVHYHRAEGDYSNWAVWMWPYKKGGTAKYTFTGNDAYGVVGTFTVPNSAKVSKVGFYLGTSTSNRDDFSDNRYISYFESRGRAEIWIVQGDETIYLAQPDVLPRMTYANIDEMNGITVGTNMPFGDVESGANGFTLTGPTTPTITSVTTDDAQQQLTLTTSANLELQGQYTLHHEGYEDIELQIGDVMTTPQFNNLYTYTGDDLGNTYTAERTDFRVWAPTASEAKLLVYPSADSTDPSETVMTESVNGTWTATLNGDQDGTIYTYSVKVGGVWREAVDPYVRSATVNGGKGVVVNLASTDPAGFRASESPEFSGEATDAVFYELHVRDLSMDASSGIKKRYKGKFLGLTQAGTTTPDGKTKTGIDAIVEMGVTHLQLLPIYDYNTVDETRKDQFNWGYDPLNYNVVEGSYSLDPTNPKSRVQDLKKTVQYLHSRGLRVVMDVVYNHVFDATQHSFEQLVPGYYFRMNGPGSFADGTGCGNEVASEKPMVRKYIVESVKYWASEYKLDGFRFDLMGILDTTTMNQVRDVLDEIDPTILVIGEGWNMGATLDDSLRAAQQNISQLARIGMFNDGVRDNVKGSVWSAGDPGWASGKKVLKNNVMQGIVGNTQYSDSLTGNWGAMQPGQSVNYVEAHDNQTLWDKLLNSVVGKTARVRVDRLSASIVMLAQGMPFLHAGQEFLRTKGGDDNSYNSGDSVNSLKWNQRTTNAATVDYYKGLIELRKAHPAFRMSTASAVAAHLHFISTGSSVIAYHLDGAATDDSWDDIVVIHNSDTATQTVTLPSSGNWKVVVNGSRAGVATITTLTGASSVAVSPQSTFVLYK